MGMKISTSMYGEIEVDEQQIFEFKEGIYGFDYVKKFAFIDSQDEQSPFKWLQALDEPELSFVTILPVEVFGEYELVISDSDMEAVNCFDPSDIIVLAIVTIPSNPKEMTANLQGPIILNPKSGMGRQVISLSERYTIKHRVLEEMQQAAGAEG